MSYKTAFPTFSAARVLRGSLLCYDRRSMAPPVSIAGPLSGLLTELESAGTLKRTKRITEACRLAESLYADAMHWSSVALAAHVAGVLRRFLAFQPDEDAVIACLLHHVLDGKMMTLAEIEERFGPAVRTLVSGIHLLAHVTRKNHRMSVDNLRLMFLRVSDDPRIVLLVLCDQCELVEHLDSLPADARRRVCQGILDLFAPVAARLGIYSLKHHMEQRAFPIVYPTDAARITEQMAQLHGRHGYFLPEAAGALQSFLKSEGVDAVVEGREKQPYSVFGKMMTKSITHVQDLYDLFALRVVVDSDATCYQVLGLLHRVGHPVTNRFKDYIAFPKPNGYQSLHTTLTRLPGVPDGVFVEVQIRTESMHREAEYGIAAHWTYKEGGRSALAMQRVQLARALTFQPVEKTGRPGPVMDHIFVLTPKGDIIELPEGATPLDFAFSVHTGLGIAYKAARVNGSIVPLTYELENGDVVEIVKQSDPRPSPQWLQLLRTAPARTRLKRYLAVRDRPQMIALGREALNTELRRRKFLPLDADLSILRAVDGKTLPVADREELLMKVGQGTVKTSGLLQRLDLLRERLAPPKKKTKKTSAKATVTAGSGTAVLRLEGNMRMPVRFARCCKANEGRRSPIIGIAGRSGEVRVHRTDCHLLKNMNPERRIKVKWT